MSIEIIGIIYHKNEEKIVEFAEELQKFLSRKKIKSIVSKDINEIIAAEPDIIITLGGDGSIIHAANGISENNEEIPIFGINFGNRGYLTVAQNISEAFVKIKRMLRGNYIITERTRIEVILYKNGKKVEQKGGLNEIVVERTGTEVISFEVVCDNETKPIEIKGDGIIIATKTGSSAYNRAAGGPILSKDSFVATMVSPTNRGEEPLYFIKPTDCVFQISGIEKEAWLVVDGKLIAKLDENCIILVKKSPIKTCFIEIGDREK